MARLVMSPSGNFVAELMGEKFTKAEVEGAIRVVGLDKAAASSHIAIKRQQEKERREAKAAEAAAFQRSLKWTHRGGPGADISPDGRTTSKSNGDGWSTAGGARLPMCGAVSLTTAGERGNLLVGLAAAEKDVSRGGSIWNDPDTWMIHCRNGNMYVGDKHIPGTGEIESQQTITIEWDQQGVSFLVDGVRRGEKHAWGSTPPTGVRVVANLFGKGRSVSFVV